ncbi:MAG: DUF1285 domain-containing protein [Pseudomonadota bacterium]
MAEPPDIMSQDPIATPKPLEDLSAVLSKLQSEAGLAKGRSLPPVHLWHPENCGDIGMEIRKDGSWWHEGVRITRDKLVRLFSTILRKDEDGIYLVTPYEKVIVHVEDAPFIAVRADKVGDGAAQALVMTTNVGDVFTVDADHPIRVDIDPETGEPSPYVEVRAGLEARIGRAPFYELVEWAEPVEDGAALAVRSNDELFRLGAV